MRHRLDRAAVHRDVREDGRRREIEIPQRVMHDLEVPLPLAGLEVQRHEALGEQVVARVGCRRSSRWSASRPAGRPCPSSSSIAICVQTPTCPVCSADPFCHVSCTELALLRESCGTSTGASRCGRRMRARSPSLRPAGTASCPRGPRRRRRSCLCRWPGRVQADIGHRQRVASCRAKRLRS